MLNVKLDEVVIRRCLEELNLELQYKRIGKDDEEIIVESAKCLAQTFAGVTVKGNKISEPMVQSVGISVEDFNEFVYAYMKNIVADGFCYAVLDKKENKVIGAFICESYNPNEESLVFTDNLEPMNKICNILDELDERLINTIQEKTNKKVEEKQFVHMFMIGVKTDKLKKEISKDLIRICLEDTKQKGYKGIFLEATNIKSQIIFSKYFGFDLVCDSNNQPILTKYADTEHFKGISPDQSTDCRVLYKAFDEEYNI